MELRGGARGRKALENVALPGQENQEPCLPAPGQDSGDGRVHQEEDSGGAEDHPPNPPTTPVRRGARVAPSAPEDVRAHGAQGIPHRVREVGPPPPRRYPRAVGVLRWDRLLPCAQYPGEGGQGTRGTRAHDVAHGEWVRWPVRGVHRPVRVLEGSTGTCLVDSTSRILSPPMAETQSFILGRRREPPSRSGGSLRTATSTCTSCRRASP